MAAEISYELPANANALPEGTGSRSHPGRAIGACLGTVAYNILIAVGYTLLGVLQDARDLSGQGKEDFLSDVSLYALFAMPLVFFLANRRLFLQRTPVVRYLLITLIVLLLSAAWLAAFTPIFLTLHGEMGGTL